VKKEQTDECCMKKCSGGLLLSGPVQFGYWKLNWSG